MEVDMRRNILPGSDHTDFKKRLKRALSVHAHGMFRWVELQLEIFFDESFPFELEEDVESELRVLESGTSVTGRSDQKDRLNVAYDRILKGRRHTAYNIVTYAFKFALYSMKALTSKELAEAVMISRKRVSGLTASSERVGVVGIDEIGRLCSNFLFLGNDNTPVRFSHHSVKEYLLDPKYLGDEFTPKTCHAFIAETCLWHAYRDATFSQIMRFYIQQYIIVHCSRADPDKRRNREFCDLLSSFCQDPKKILHFGESGLISPFLFYRDYSGPNNVAYLSQERQFFDLTFFCACLFNFAEVLWPTLAQLRLNPIQRRRLKREGFKVACDNNCYEVAKELLEDDREPIEVTVIDVEAVASCSSGRLMQLVLEHSQDVEFTLNIAKNAVQNTHSSIEVMEALINHYHRFPMDLWIIDYVFEVSTESVKMLDVILSGVDSSIPTDILLIYASQHDLYPEQLLSTVFRHRWDVFVTDGILEAVARNYFQGYEAVRAIVEYSGGCVRVSEEVVLAAVSNYFAGEDILRYLCRIFGDDVIITEAVVVNAVANGDAGILHVLLEHKPDIDITEPIVSAAVRNRIHSTEVIKLLLSHDPKIPVTEETLVIAAQNWQSGFTTMEYLMEHIPWIQITPKIMEATAANKSLVNQLSKLLIEQVPGSIIEDKILEVAASNKNIGESTFQMLLDHSNISEIGHRIMDAAAGNIERGECILALLFKHAPGYETPISSIEMVAASRNVNCFEILLKHFDKDKMTGDLFKSLLKVAIRDTSRPRVLVKTVLDHSNHNLHIPEEVMIYAVQRNSPYEIESSVSVLLESGRTVTITENVLKLAATNGPGLSDRDLLLADDKDLKSPRL
ncbi:uncharacterized protein F4822DRAFT_403415 [Hypoxylon trugodes]|uniref:uncharacterized protein n=1 Tax=Hypoxylon trugodes TaxID=326681 RepID=UPI002193A0F7|nr:uncharacterized protein F4822DRAFT_403415 [Hypoxylon trugodes]KAI1388637.1 hypothetical protein F4822DRAFT_403415 [Hypoxylon trugodes]